MKYSEMNDRQKNAFKNIKWAARNLIGGLENTICDYPDEDEGKEANALLHDREYLVNEIYSMATSGYYREGFEGFGEQFKKMVKDIRFCGKEWLMDQVKHRVALEGY